MFVINLFSPNAQGKLVVRFEEINNESFSTVEEAEMRGRELAESWHESLEIYDTTLFKVVKTITLNKVEEEHPVLF